MAGPLFVGAENVILRPDTEHYGSSRPIMEGIQIVDHLRRFPASLLAIYCHTQDRDAAEFFCKINGLNEAQVIIPPPVDQKLKPYQGQWHAFQRQRAMGPINLVLTGFAGIWVKCTNTHQPVLLYGRRGALGSDPEYASWEDLQERVRESRAASVEGSSSQPE